MENNYQNNNLTDLTDELLAKKSLTDQLAFAELVNRYQAKLKRYVTRLAKLEEIDIDDILQETFIKAYLNLNDFDENLKFSSWLYRITHNETINHFRKKSVKYEIGVDLNNEVSEEFWVENNLKEIDQRLDHQRIQQTLAKLPANYRDVLILKYFEEKNYQEISDILKKPAGTIASWLNRAKEQFSKLHQTYER